MLTEWMGVLMDAKGQTKEVLSLANVLQRTDLNGTQLANDGVPVDVKHIQAALPAVVQTVERHLKPIKLAFDASCRVRLEVELAKLKALQEKHFEQLEFDFSKGIEQVNAAKRKQLENDTTDLFKQYQQWVRDTLELDDRAQFTVVAVLASGGETA